MLGVSVKPMKYESRVVNNYAESSKPGTSEVFTYSPAASVDFYQLVVFQPASTLC